MTFKGLELPSRFLLSPLAGLYEPARFAWPCGELGGLGLATTDLVNARALLRANARTLELIQTCPEDRPVAVQIYGSEPKEMGEAARWLEDYGVSAVDINMGCPVHKVTRGGGGSALFVQRHQHRATGAGRRRSRAYSGDGKMRLGWDDSSLERAHSWRASSNKSALPRSLFMDARASRVFAAKSIATASAPWSRLSRTCPSSAMATFAPSPTPNRCF